MTSALFGLLGVLLGAAVSFAGTAWSDRSRRQHEWALLARNERLAAYGAFATAAKEYVALLYRIAGGLGIDRQSEHLSWAEADPLLAAAYHRRDTAFETMRLVGSADCTARAGAWVKEFSEMRDYLRSPSPDEAGWSSRKDRANQARDRFHAQAREELASRVSSRG